MRITYTSSSGKFFEFSGGARCKIKTANFHNWAFTPQATSLQYGESVQMLKRAAAQYPVELYVTGDKWEREVFLRGFHEAAAADLFANKTGVLQWGDWKLDCYISSSSTFPHAERQFTTVNQVTVYAPRPFWYRLDEIEIVIPEVTITGGLNFPFDFEYDFTEEDTAYMIAESKHYKESDFILKIQGYANAPCVRINGHPYQVYAEVAEGSVLTVDSREKTVITTYPSGRTINNFAERRKDYSLFQKVPAGPLVISLNGDFSATLGLIYERNEPTLWI